MKVILELNGKREEFNTVEHLLNKYPTDVSDLKKDKGFGFCSCGMPRIESQDKKYLYCYEEAYCKNNEKPILK